MNTSRLWRHAWVILAFCSAYTVFYGFFLFKNEFLSLGKVGVAGAWLFIAVCSGFYAHLARRAWVYRHHIHSTRSFFRLVRLRNPQDFSRIKVPRSLDRATYYVEGIELKNIRCFDELILDFTNHQDVSPATLIVGDNGTGKSTILRSLAIGLCPESEAVGLMKRIPGKFLRHGRDEGSIVVMLRSGEKRAMIKTRIDKKERVRQTTTPNSFPWQDVFVCGYGTQRTAENEKSPVDYERQFAVGSLFSDSAALMNPEVVFLRREPEERRILSQILLEVLMLDPADWSVDFTNSGLELTGPWGSQPVASVADGYRCTTKWVLDYLGWQLLAGRFSPKRNAGGILLIDEIEQHLHPRWQRFILQRLREKFPTTQLIVTTHTPLVTAGAADLEGAQVLSIVSDEPGRVRVFDIPKTELRGRRADQILTSVFGRGCPSDR